MTPLQRALSAVSFSFLVLISACGKDQSNGSSGESGASSATQTARYSYKFELNGCSTGEHTAATKAELCNMLSDESANHFCAPGMRAEYSTRYECPATPSPNTVSASAAHNPGNTGISVYQFLGTYNGHSCTTGTHSGNTRESLCGMLSNEALNHYCAADRRAEMRRTLECESEGSPQ